MTNEMWELNVALREANRALSKVIETLDSIDYESAGSDKVDDAMSKAYQALFGAGDKLNEARYFIKKGKK